MTIQYSMTAGQSEDRLDSKAMLPIFEKISAAFASEANLLPVPAEDLLESYTQGLAVLAMHVEGFPVGYTRLQYLLTSLHPDGEWLELGGTWVHSEYRSRGINETMYNLLLPRHRARNILATTTNPISRAIGERLNLVLLQRMKLPKTVWQASCICPLNKTGSSAKDNSGCKHAWGEPQLSENPCWFRVTAETAERLK